jgi:hypothetical protein
MQANPHTSAIRKSIAQRIKDVKVVGQHTIAKDMAMSVFLADTLQYFKIIEALDKANK